MFRIPERIHKRPFFVASAVIAGILLISGAVLYTLGNYGFSSQIPRVTIHSETSGKSVGTVGLNLRRIPSSNLIANPSFEKIQYDQVYTAASAANGVVYVQNPSSGSSDYAQDFFAGGTLRVGALDKDGNFVTVMETGITGFASNQLGISSALSAPADVPETESFSAIASSSSTTVAVGTAGLLVSDLTAAAPVVVSLGISENISDISCVGDRFFAITETGKFLSSADGKAWSLFSADAYPSTSFHTVTSAGKIGIAGGDGGAVLICSDGIVNKGSSGTTQTIRTSCSDGKIALLAGDNGTVLATSNGVLFRQLTEEELHAFLSPANWVCSTEANGVFLLAGVDGEIAVGTLDATSGKFTFENRIAVDSSGARISAKRVQILPTGEYLLLDTIGNLYCSDSASTSWNLVSDSEIPSVDMTGLSSQGKIILSHGILSRITQIYTRIQYENPQTDAVISSGDLCYLSSARPSAFEQKVAGSWESAGGQTDLKTQEDAPAGGGQFSLLMTGLTGGMTDDVHCISQVLSDGSTPVFEADTIYQAKVWLKQSGISDHSVMLWVSGGFESTGTTFTDVGGGWRQYTYTFVLPAGASKTSQNEVRLNIAFRGAGALSVDKVFLGKADSAETGIPDVYTSAITASNPGLLRLENVSIGRLGCARDAWLLPSGNESNTTSPDTTLPGTNSLESSLVLAKKAGATPWLVIGSGADSDTVDQLLGYLCGTISDPYGKIRLDNGTAVPWSMQFERIVLEIGDPDDVFQTDLQRAAYVNYILDRVAASPYYVDIKDKLVFLDGMAYSGGTMRSKADYHTADLTITNILANSATVLSFGTAVQNGYSDYFDRIPRMPSTSDRPSEGAGEWIRSTEVNLFAPLTKEGGSAAPATITTAGYARILLDDLGSHSSNALLTIPVTLGRPLSDYESLFGLADTASSDSKITSSNSKTLLATISALRDAVTGTGMVTEIDTSNALSENAADGLYVYAFRNAETIRVVSINTSEQTIMFSLALDTTMNGASTQIYRTNGEKGQSGTLSERDSRISLLPGEICIAEIPVA